MTEYDPRLTAARPELAAEFLRGKVQAAAYAEGVAQRIMVPVAPLRREPEQAASIATQLLFGENIVIYGSANAEPHRGWAWGQAERDSYVGWVPEAALGRLHQPTHKIRALSTFIYPEPSIKAPSTMALSFGSIIAVAAEEGQFLRLKSGGFIFAAHAGSLDARESDPVGVAERFLGVPYLWGGRSSLGLDCSGLVQTALEACGIACPRDSDMQERALGSVLDPGLPPGEFRRGDLLFWKGHVAMVRDRTTMIHATAYTMTVIVEETAPALARIAAGGSPLRTIRRLDSAIDRVQAAAAT